MAAAATAPKISPEIFKTAKTRVPKGWNKVVAVHVGAVGVDLHGQDDTCAALKAVEQAMEHTSFPAVLDIIPGGPDATKCQVVVGVPYPDGVKKEEVMKCIPYKNAELLVVKGGLRTPTGMIIPALGDPEPKAGKEQAEMGDDTKAIRWPDEAKVAVASVTVGW